MDLVNCQVKLRGDQYHTVSKLEVSVPEIACLRHIHGVDAVVNIKPVKHTRINKLELRSRLEEIYSDKVVNALWGESKQTAHNLPTRLAEIGITKDSEFLDPVYRALQAQKSSDAIAPSPPEEEDEEDFDEDEDFFDEDEDPAEEDLVSSDGGDEPAADESIAELQAELAALEAEEKAAIEAEEAAEAEASGGKKGKGK